MADMSVIVDCTTGELSRVALTADQAAAVAAIQDQAAQEAAAEQAKVDDRNAALDQLKTLAAQSQPVDAALLARVLGVA